MGAFLCPPKFCKVPIIRGAHKSIRDYSLSIGATAFLATCIGLRLAKFLPPSFGVRLEILGGVTMMLIGVYTLFQS